MQWLRETDPVIHSQAQGLVWETSWKEGGGIIWASRLKVMTGKHTETAELSYRQFKDPIVIATELA